MEETEFLHTVPTYEMTVWADSSKSVCEQYPGLWKVVVGSDGNCYNICEAEQIAFPVDCSARMRSGSVLEATTTTTATKSSWMSQSTVIQGIPNWMVAAGGIVLAAVLLNN